MEHHALHHQFKGIPRLFLRELDLTLVHGLSAILVFAGQRALRLAICVLCPICRSLVRTELCVRERAGECSSLLPPKRKSGTIKHRFAYRLYRLRGCEYLIFLSASKTIMSSFRNLTSAVLPRASMSSIFFIKLSSNFKRTHPFSLLQLKFRTRVLEKSTEHNKVNSNVLLKEAFHECCFRI